MNSGALRSWTYRAGAFALATAALVLFAAVVGEQSARAAPVSWAVQLTPAQVVPPTASTVAGFAVLSFDPETRVFTYSVTFLTTPGNQITGVTLRRGAAGQTGSIVAQLSPGGQAQFSGSITLSVPDAADLARGLLYIEVTSVDNPAGAARGQLLPPAHLPTPTLVPPTATPVPPTPVAAPPGAFGPATGGIIPPSTGDAGLR